MKLTVGFSTALLRGLLWFYPRPFRRRFAGEMVEVFAERCADVATSRGTLGLAALWMRTYPGVIRAAFLERAEGWSRARAPHKSRPPRQGFDPKNSRLPRKAGGFMDRLAQDFLYGIRRLIRSPGFTAVAVVTLGLGIGINTTVFSLVNAFLFRPLPHVEEPGRLVALFSGEGDDRGVSSYMDYLDFRREAAAFEGLAAYKPLLMDLADSDDTERVQGMIVSGNYFDVLGVAPERGRFFAAGDDDEPDGETVAVLGHSLWESRFAADPDIVGKSVRLNGRSFTVLGVAPAGFRGTYLESRPQVFAPMMMQAHFMPASGSLLDRRGWGGILVVGRLADGVSFSQAEASVAAVASWLYEEFPDLASWGREYEIVPFGEATLMPEARGMVVQFSGLLMGVMALVLMVACVNVANLTLSRAVQRRGEIAVRQALGAGRVRLVRQLLIESVTLAVLGGGVGLVMALGSERLLRALPFPVELDLGIDSHVMIFALLVSLVTGVVFGLVPAARASRVDVSRNLRRLVGGEGRGSRWNLTNGLVVAQVALSLVLLVGAGLFARTLINLGAIELGFDADNVLVATVDPALQGYEGTEIESFYGRLMPQVEAIPGVITASLVSALPGPQNDNFWSATIEGYAPEPGDSVGTYVTYAAADYFETVGIAIVQGRGFTPSDDGDAPIVIVVNETAARGFGERTGREALGERISFQGPEGPYAEIIGIAADSKVGALRGEPRAQTYLPHAQLAPRGMGARMTLLVRTGSADPYGVLPQLRAAVQRTDPNVPVFSVDTLEGHLSATLFQERLSAALMSFSALLALVLASVGLYGVLSYSVSRRTREMGIRLALGAGTGDVRGMVVRQGMALVLIGGAIGGGASIALSSLLSSFLYGVSALDPITYGAVAVALGGVAFLASHVPARRATRVDPITALRSD